MKYRKIPSLPTREDRVIWLRLNLPLNRPTPKIMVGAAYHDSDRRDAELMHTRTHRQAFFCAVCWEHIASDACTVDHEIRLRRPFHPNSLGALLRDAVKWKPE